MDNMEGTVIFKTLDSRKERKIPWFASTNVERKLEKVLSRRAKIRKGGGSFVGGAPT